MWKKGDKEGEREGGVAVFQHQYPAHTYCLCTYRKGDKVLMNKEGGYILRTKPVHVNEGGVAMGAGSLDSPSLISGSDFIRTVC